MAGKSKAGRRRVRFPPPPPPPPPPPLPHPPPFFELPRVPLRLSDVPEYFANSYAKMIKGTIGEIICQSHRENNRTPEMLRRLPIPLAPVGQDTRFRISWHASAEIDHNMKLHRYAIPVLPKHGFFVVCVEPPRLWGNGMMEAVKVLYRFADLYAMGFWYEAHWYIFKDILEDIKLDGLLSAEEQEMWVRELPFDSSYGPSGMKVDFAKLRIGPLNLMNTCKVLSNYGNQTQEEVQEALARMGIMVSEAVRSSKVARWTEMLCREWLEEPVNTKERKYSVEFHTYKAKCEDICDKEDTMSAKEYEELLQDITAFKK